MEKEKPTVWAPCWVLWDKAGNAPIHMNCLLVSSQGMHLYLGFCLVWEVVQLIAAYFVRPDPSCTRTLPLPPGCSRHQSQLAGSSVNSYFPRMATDLGSCNAVRRSSLHILSALYSLCLGAPGSGLSAPHLGLCVWQCQCQERILTRI